MKKLINSIIFVGFAMSGMTHVMADEPENLIIMESAPGIIKRKSIILIKKANTEQITKGIQLGSFTLLPDVIITEYYDDNIYATETALRDDFITVLTPNIKIKSNWDKHALNVETGVEVVRYTEFTTENTENAWVNLNGTYDFGMNKKILAGYSYTRDHEDRGTEDTTAGKTPVKFDDTSAHAGYSAHMGNNYFKVFYNSKYLNYYDVDSLSGTVLNDDRDRHEQGIGLRYLFRHSNNTAFYIDGVTDNRDYDNSTDFEGNDRDSKGYRYSIGIEHVNTEVISKLFIGKIFRNYQSGVFKDANEFDYGIKYNWKYNAASNVMIQTKRSIEETTLNNSPGYLMDDISAGLAIDLTETKNINLNVINTKTKYYEITRRDDYQTFSAGYTHKLQKNLLFNIDIIRSERKSNVSGENYKVNQVFIRINAAI